MAKNFLNDIKPLKRDEKSRPSILAKPLPESDRPLNLPPKFTDQGYSAEPPRRRSRMIWIVAILVIVAAVIGISSFFSKAEVMLTPKSIDLALDKTVYNAVLDGSDPALTFKVVKVSGKAEKNVTATQKSEASTKATGRVVIFNSFSSAVQKLDIETRLATKEGKIFKTDTAVVVPGTKLEAGKVVPGQIEVGVHAN